MSKDRLIYAIIDLLHDRHHERAIATALELLVTLSGAVAVHLELRDERDVVYARSHRSATSARRGGNTKTVRSEIGVPPVGTLVIVGPSDPEAVRELLELFTFVLATRSERLIRAAVGRPVPMLHEAVRLFERRYAIEAIECHRGNMSAAARALGIARSTLYELVADMDDRPGQGLRKRMLSSAATPAPRTQTSRKMKQ